AAEPTYHSRLTWERLIPPGWSYLHGVTMVDYDLDGRADLLVSDGVANVPNEGKMLLYHHEDATGPFLYSPDNNGKLMVINIPTGRVVAGQITHWSNPADGSLDFNASGNPIAVDDKYIWMPFKHAWSTSKEIICIDKTNMAEATRSA